MKTGITKRQSEILSFIRSRIEKENLPPTIIEICDHFGFASTNGVHQQLKALEKKGFIRRPGKGRSRGIILRSNSGVRKSQTSEKMLELNIISGGDSSDPMSPFFTSNGSIRINPENFQLTGRVFAAKAADDSMQLHGINKGDIVIACHGSQPIDSQIIICLVNDNLLIRQFSKISGGSEIISGKRGFPKMQFADNDPAFAVIGIAKGLIKRL